jgi:hypothetical protein
MSVVVVISQHLLNVFVQLANKRGLKKQKTNLSLCLPTIVARQLLCRKVTSAINTHATTEGLKNAVLWDVALCGFIIKRRFVRTYRLHLQDRRNNASEEKCWRVTKRSTERPDYNLGGGG